LLFFVIARLTNLNSPSNSSSSILKKFLNFFTMVFSQVWQMDVKYFGVVNLDSHARTHTDSHLLDCVETLSCAAALRSR